MTGWRKLQGETHMMYSPVGFALVDDFTGRAPLGRIKPKLELQHGNGGPFELVDVVTAVTLSRVIVYPGLERRRNAAIGTPRRYRMTLEAELYTPHYRGTPLGDKDGIQFNAFPYNDEVEPALLPEYVPVALLPAVNYPFESQYPVIHGVVIDDQGAPAAAVFVSHAQDRVFTDARGSFSLPIRKESTAATILAEDLETGKHGDKTVDLTNIAIRDRNVTITIKP